MGDTIIKVAIQGFDWISLVSTIFVLLGILAALFAPLWREKREREKKAMIIRSCLLRPLNAIDSKLGQMLDGTIEAGRLLFEEQNKRNFQKVEDLLEKSDCLPKKKIAALEGFIDYFKQCDQLSSSDRNGVNLFRQEVKKLIAELQ